ncbi:hypothetical protein HYU06_07420 [Candidatus Woesearchaeota archaeon]|nr:hypothetical protein [Candidatus Woesearchaeota archaeon]
MTNALSTGIITTDSTTDGTITGNEQNTSAAFTLTIDDVVNSAEGVQPEAKKEKEMAARKKTGVAELTQEALYIRKLVNDLSAPEYQSELNLVKIVAQNANLRSITLENYEAEFRNPARSFYVLEDEQGVPISIMSVIERTKKNGNQYKYSQFKTGIELTLGDAIATEAGYAYQTRRSYRILKTALVYAMTQPELANALGLPVLTKNKKLLSVVTGKKNPTDPLKDETECNVRDGTEHILAVDKELEMITIGYSANHGGYIHITDSGKLNELFGRNTPAIAAEGNRLELNVLVNAGNKIVGYAAPKYAAKANAA